MIWDETPRSVVAINQINRNQMTIDNVNRIPMTMMTIFNWFISVCTERIISQTIAVVQLFHLVFRLMIWWATHRVWAFHTLYLWVLSSLNSIYLYNKSVGLGHYMLKYLCYDWFSPEFKEQLCMNAITKTILMFIITISETNNS